MLINNILYVLYINNFNDKERELVFNRQKTIFLEIVKGWLKREKISKPKLVPELKIEISSLISLEIVRKGRSFSEGVFIK